MVVVRQEIVLDFPSVTIYDITISRFIMEVIIMYIETIGDHQVITLKFNSTDSLDPIHEATIGYMDDTDLDHTILFETNLNILTVTISVSNITYTHAMEITLDIIKELLTSGIPELTVSIPERINDKDVFGIPLLPSLRCTDFCAFKQCDTLVCFDIACTSIERPDKTNVFFLTLE